jgi:Peptidase A4 family
MDVSPGVAGRRAGRRRHRGAGGRGSGRAGGRGRARGPAAVCLVAATGLVLGGATARNLTQAPRGGHERVNLLADALITGAQWSGYVVHGDSYNVGATFTVSTLYCQSWQNGPGSVLWAGIQSKDTNGTATIVQDGIGYGCDNGQPQYYAWTVQDAYSGRVVPLPDPVQPGDAIFASVFEEGAEYWMYVDDETQSWSVLNSLTGGAASSNTAAVAAESYDGGAFFNPVAVTGAQVNGVPVGQSNPQALEQDPSRYDGTAGLDPGPLDATDQNFSFSWNGPPNLALMSGEIVPAMPGQPPQG